MARFELNIYGQDDEIIKTYKADRVRYGVTLEALKAAEQPLVIDFWAEWCGPCRMISPIIDELATEYEGKVTIGKCDHTTLPRNR